MTGDYDWSYDLDLSTQFIYSEKATKFCEIFTLVLTTVYTVKSKIKISQNFVAYSEYMNFKYMIELEIEKIPIGQKSSIQSSE